MWEKIIEIAMSDGLWAGLFCCLFVYQLKDSRSREKKYCEIVDNLTERLKTVENIERTCSEIRDFVHDRASL